MFDTVFVLQRCEVIETSLEVVTVVDVEHGPVVDRAGKIRGHAAARGEREVDALDLAVIGKAHLVVDHEIMALAGHDHVRVTIQPQLDGTSGARRKQGRDAGKQGSLGFLAPKAAAHPAALHRHVLGLQAQRVRHQHLYFARMLGGTVYQHRAVFLGQGERDLAFQVKVILPAGVQAPAQTMGGVASIACAASPRERRGCGQYERLTCHGVINAQHRCQRLGNPPLRWHCPAGQFSRARGHRKQRLTERT